MSDSASPTVSTGPVGGDEDPIYRGASYKPVPSNWYTAKPYGFRFTPKSGQQDAKTFFLPLGPSNLSISTQFATNLIPTLYGTVEEHSPVRYYDIVLEGTTGMAPKYVDPATNAPEVQVGRSAFTVQQSLSTFSEGFLSKTLTTGQTAFNTATEIGNVFGRSAVTGVYLNQTGYMAFHNLYRFLLKYKKDVSGLKDDGTYDATPRKAGAAPPLVFFNHKDNNEYSVVIKNFVLRRDKENPMLYFYNISLRGYDLRDLKSTVGTEKITQSNEMLKNLGLDGVKSSTYLSKAKDVASLGRDMLSSISIGVNQFGR